MSERKPAYGLVSEFGGIGGNLDTTPDDQSVHQVVVRGRNDFYQRYHRSFAVSHKAAISLLLGSRRFLPPLRRSRRRPPELAA
jgi:hypothetical protein